MNLQIRLGSDDDVEELVRLSLLAWAPIFDSFRQVLGSAIYSIIYPDWQTTQQETVETFCKKQENTVVWVAELESSVVGFLVYELNHKDRDRGTEWPPPSHTTAPSGHPAGPHPAVRLSPTKGVGLAEARQPQLLPVGVAECLMEGR